MTSWPLLCFLLLCSSDAIWHFKHRWLKNYSRSRWWWLHENNSDLVTRLDETNRDNILKILDISGLLKIGMSLWPTGVLVKQSLVAEGNARCVGINSNMLSLIHSISQSILFCYSFCYSFPHSQNLCRALWRLLRSAVSLVHMHRTVLKSLRKVHSNRFKSY